MTESEDLVAIHPEEELCSAHGELADLCDACLYEKQKAWNYLREEIRASAQILESRLRDLESDMEIIEVYFEEQGLPLAPNFTKILMAYVNITRFAEFGVRQSFSGALK